MRIGTTGLKGVGITTPRGNQVIRTGDQDKLRQFTRIVENRKEKLADLSTVKANPKARHLVSKIGVQASEFLPGVFRSNLPKVEAKLGKLGIVA